MPTMRDVANRAGVSTATVSYVLNGTATVSDETRARVLAAAEALRYQPNHSARALRTRSRTIGLVVAALADRLLDSAAAEVLAGLSEAAAQRNYFVLLAGADDSADEVELVERLGRSGRVDGMVLLDLRLDDPRAAALDTAGVPWVAADGLAEADAADRPALSFDIGGGVHQALDHLAELGHQAIAFITPPSDLAASEELIGAYIDWHQRRLREFDSALLLEAGVTGDAGYQAMQELLDSELPFSAVLVGSDTLAVGVIHALHQAGCNVPADVSVVGLGDLPIACHLLPPLTTLRAPRRRLGAALAEHLITAIEGERPKPESIGRLAYQLIRRASTATMRRTEPAQSR